MNSRLKDSLQRAVDCLPHPSFETIADAPVQKMEQMDVITRQNAQEPFWRRRAFASRLAAACICLFICLATGNNWYERNLRVYSVISLDVNPSFEIKAGKSDRVIALRGCSADAQALLEGKNYRNLKVDEAVEALIHSMREGRYLNENQRTVLLTVGSRNEQAQARLTEHLMMKIKDSLREENFRPVVVCQKADSVEIKDLREIEKEAERWSVSPGKMQLIRTIMRYDTGRTAEEMASMPVEQILSAYRTQGREIPEELEFDEEWDDGPEDGEKDRADGKDDGPEDGEKDRADGKDDGPEDEEEDRADGKDDGPEDDEEDRADGKDDGPKADREDADEDDGPEEDVVDGEDEDRQMTDERKSVRATGQSDRQEVRRKPVKIEHKNDEQDTSQSQYRDAPEEEEVLDEEEDTPEGEDALDREEDISEEKGISGEEEDTTDEEEDISEEKGISEEGDGRDQDRDSREDDGDDSDGQEDD